MNKDVIYIDVDDDVTAIIGKIKSAKEKVVALVPPKRSGALQSAVNLRLLERMAKNDKKKLVLITNSHALMALAANAQIPVAKNLQSKPELAEIPAIIVDDDDDIIDGSELPVGDHAGSLKVKDGTRPGVVPKNMRSDDIDATDLEIDNVPVATSAAASLGDARAAGRKAGLKGKSKVPSFNTFRKKFVIALGAGTALIALLVWMFVFAPAATVVITARTAPQAVSAPVRLAGVEATDFEKGAISSVVQEEKKDEVIEFDATGQKDVGEKATGTVRFSTSDADTVVAGATIPAGTVLKTTSGLSFITTAPAVISTQNYRNVQVGVTAAESGTNYNTASGSLSGAPARISASFVSPAAGGTSKVTRVVSPDDIERAKGELIGRSTDAQKKALLEKFVNGEIVIESSYTVNRADPVSAPAVNQEAASGKATLTIPTTYTVQGVAKNELEKYLKASLESDIEKSSRKIYSTGVESATLSNFRKDGEAQLATVNATGEIGPTINEDSIKEQVKGKRYGEVQQSLEAMDGIKEVDTQFSYFWVRTVPGDVNKITIEFKVEDE